MSGQVIAGGWVPGLPFVLNAQKGKPWQELDRGLTTLATHIRELKPDVIVLNSTQWFSVLGTSFQVKPHLKGVHVDENWYEWGDLAFDFKCDSGLGERFAKDVAALGYPTKTVNFEEFPIDTGTIVALRYLNPDGKIPVATVSSWVYADSDKARAIGEAMRGSIEASGRRAVVIASSLLSTRYFTDEINPAEDKVSKQLDDEWNRKILGVFESGDLIAGIPTAKEFAKSVPTDMQFNAYHWLAGTMPKRRCTGQVLAYGPQWGTGAAVVEFRPEAK